MSTNQPESNHITVADIEEGVPVYTDDGKKLGRVAELREHHFRVDVSFKPDYWLDADYVTSAGERVVMQFGGADLSAHKLRVQDVQQATDTATAGTSEVLLSEREQREQRERMEEQLAKQRREIAKDRPEDQI